MWGLRTKLVSPTLAHDAIASFGPLETPDRIDTRLSSSFIGRNFEVRNKPVILVYESKIAVVYIYLL